MVTAAPTLSFDVDVTAGDGRWVRNGNHAIWSGRREANKLPYVLRQISIGTPGWFAAARPYHTTCTSIGAVVNASADRNMSEKVAQTLLEDGSSQSQRPWYAAVGRAFVVAYAEVRRLVVGAGEVITARILAGTALVLVSVFLILRRD